MDFTNSFFLAAVVWNGREALTIEEARQTASKKLGVCVVSIARIFAITVRFF